MDPLTLITEIKPLASTHFAGEQHQRLPFAQGQLLQGVITAKDDSHQFTLEINGQKITAESTAQLQVGQKLDLQVTSLMPRMELQIVSNNPINHWLGNLIPQLAQQSLLMPEVATLAGDAQLMAQLSPATQETLQFYAGGMQNSGGENTAPVSPITVQLLEFALKLTTVPPEQTLQGQYEKIGELLQQFSLSPSLTPDAAQQAKHIAALFTQATGAQETAVPARLTAASIFTPSAEGETEALTTLIGRLTQNDPGKSTTFSQLLPFVQVYTTLPTTNPLRQLLSFLIKTESGQSQPGSQQAPGLQMEEYLNRLGINMEHLLAENETQAAGRTLKFALLELSQQAATNDKSTVSAEQLIKTLESYQLLQIRLANDALSFLPLPFSFLNQGYLLVENDRSGGQQESGQNQADQADKTVELHLQLEGLGNLQINIRQKEDHLELRFMTESIEKAKFVAGYREDLEQWITSGRLDSVQFLVGAKEPIKTLLEKITSGGTGMIDTRA